MTIKYGFFNSSSGDRVYDADDFNRFTSQFVTDGVYPDTDTALQVTTNGDSVKSVIILKGSAIVGSHYYYMDADQVLTLSDPSATYTRVDAVMLKCDTTARTVTLYIKNGTPAATPEPPACTRTSTVAEIMLGYVTIPKNATSLSSANITDTRSDTSKCGYVRGKVSSNTIFFGEGNPDATQGRAGDIYIKFV